MLIVHACYADVPLYYRPLTNPQGVYTVADASSLGSNGTTGLAAGWTLVVYEDPLQLQNPLQLLMDLVLFLMLVIPVSGFITPPSGPVNINLDLPL
jgi:hypothetical protein